MKLSKSLFAAFLAVTLLVSTGTACLAAETGHENAGLWFFSGLAGIEEEKYTVTYITENTSTQETVTAGRHPVKTPELPEGCALWRDNHGYILSPSETEIWSDITFTALPQGALSLTNGRHIKFMEAAPDGLFHPYNSTTRAEAAQILYSLMQSSSQQEPADYSDVPTGEAYSRPMGVLGALGLLRAEEDGTIRPQDPITRAEFAWMAGAFLPKAEPSQRFTDVPAGYWAYDAINAAAAQGLFSGYADGTFRPKGYLSRAETAAVIGRLLGRTADQNAVNAAADSISIYPDVPTTHWAYWAITEATVSHDHIVSEGYEVWTKTDPRPTKLTNGFHTIGGRLYLVENGKFFHSATSADGYFTFDANGRYTTGSAALDDKLASIVASQVNSSMSRDEKLRALYNYVRDNYSYLKRGLVTKNETNWEPAYAEEFIKTKMGNCFSYAALYCLLARQTGVPAYTVVGKLGVRTVQDHGWVEIALDGATYLFDSELEWSYLHKYNKRVDLFKIDINNAPYTYTR